MSVYIENLVNAKLRNMKNMNNVYEVGHVSKVKDYILEVVGLESVGFYERVVIANHSVGYVTAIEKNTVMVALLQRTNAIYVGDEVVTTSGIIGTITNVKTDRFVIKVDDNTKIEVYKAFVQSRVTKPELRSGNKNKK